jgi:hypothetical protein
VADPEVVPLAIQLFNYTQECSRGHAAKAEHMQRERTPPRRGRPARPELVRLKELLLGGGAIESDIDYDRAKMLLQEIRNQKFRYSDKAGCEQAYIDQVAKEKVVIAALNAAARLLWSLSFQYFCCCLGCCCCCRCSFGEKSANTCCQSCCLCWCRCCWCRCCCCCCCCCLC